MQYEQIWAPWRLTYVQGCDDKKAGSEKPLELLPGADPGCFLCQAVADSDDQSNRVVVRGAHCVTILNRYPYNNGHLLIAPRLHLARLDELQPAVQQEISATMTEMVAVLERVLRPHGFNVGLNLGRSAGAGLPGHLHWHVVPRWDGDTNFMPALAGIKVIAQSLDALWNALGEELQRTPSTS